MAKDKQGGPSLGVTVRVAEAKLHAARQLRREATRAEARVWELVRGRRLDGLKFRRQQPVFGFIADFYCAELNLVIEVDGAVHDDQSSVIHDEQRDEILRARGVRVVRIRNEDVSIERLLAVVRNAR